MDDAAARYCTTCGAAREANDVYCRQCGSAFATTALVQRPQAPDRPRRASQRPPTQWVVLLLLLILIAVAGIGVLVWRNQPLTLSAGESIWCRNNIVDVAAAALSQGSSIAALSDSPPNAPYIAACKAAYAVAVR